MESKDFYEILKTRRSIRRFKQDPVKTELLEKLVDVARYAPSGGNRQPWEFIAVNDTVINKTLFANIQWLKSAGTPPEGKEPTAYIVVLANPKLSGCYLEDCAAATQNILLSAWSEGIGSCWIGSLNSKNIRQLLSIPINLEITAVIALGYSDETASAEEKKQSLMPYRDEKKVLKVPKKPLAEILHYNGYKKSK